MKNYSFNKFFQILLLLLISNQVFSHYQLLSRLKALTDKKILRKAKCLIPKGVDHLSRALLLQQCFSDKYGDGNETRCYDELGCFPMEAPWVTILRPLPIPYPPEDIDTGISLYTRKAPNGFEVQLWPNIILDNSDFNYKKPTVFITHGFSSNGFADWLLDLKDAYLENVDANVFVMDWGNGASLTNYFQVASNTRIVGAELLRFGQYLIENGLKTEQMHLIGHSLGAHIMSYMAKGLKEPNPVNRITALDPAQPVFELADNEVRLHKDDAKYVDAIHTDAKPFIPFVGFGMIQPVGHVDFYLNGGAQQPGCLIIAAPPKISSFKDIMKIPVETVSKWVSCSHGRSYEYFTWALKLKNCTIWGRKMSTIENILKITTLGTLKAFDPIVDSIKNCDEEKCSILGLHTFKLKARGAFAVTTLPYEPYCESVSLPKQLTKVVENIFSKIKFWVNKFRRSKIIIGKIRGYISGDDDHDHDDDVEDDYDNVYNDKEHDYYYEESDF